MERPRELRAICQAGKEGPAWYVLHRRISIYITWALLHTPIRLNQVSLLMMACGLAGAALITSRRLEIDAAGFALLYLSFLLDKVDGEMARYRRRASVHGILLDRFHHRWVEPCIFIAAAWREYQVTTAPTVLLASLGTIILANGIEEVQQLSPYILAKHVRETRAWPEPFRSGAARWFERLHGVARPLKAFRTFVVVLPLLVIAYALEAWTYWPWITYYLYASVAALALFVVIQSAYYYAAGLDAELAELRDPLAAAVRAESRGALPRTEGAPRR